MADLREEVARRLYRAQTPLGNHQVPWERTAAWHQDRFCRIADECIRLMEWARRECNAWEVVERSAPWAEVAEFEQLVPLTLPPDTWEAPDGK